MYMYLFWVLARLTYSYLFKLYKLHWYIVRHSKLKQLFKYARQLVKSMHLKIHIIILLILLHVFARLGVLARSIY